jgi:hypothetical protein
MNTTRTKKPARTTRKAFAGILAESLANMGFRTKPATARTRKPAPAKALRTYRVHGNKAFVQVHASRPAEAVRQAQSMPVIGIHFRIGKCEVELLR